MLFVQQPRAVNSLRNARKKISFGVDLLDKLIHFPKPVTVVAVAGFMLFGKVMRVRKD